jgi:hypothetical protein
MKGLALAALLFAAGAQLHAQSFGESFPVADTRYRPAFGTPRLTTNGSDFFLFWTADQKTRVTRIREGQPRTGQVIFDTNQPVHVAWTGKRFLAVTALRGAEYSYYGPVVARVLNAEAQPVGAEIVFAKKGTNPQVVAGTDSVAVLYEEESKGYVLAILDLDGRREISHQPFTPRGNHRIARRGRGFIVVTIGSYYSNSYVRMLDERGNTVSTQVIPRPGSWSEVGIASDGNRALVVLFSGQDGVSTLTIDESGAVGPLVTIAPAWSPRSSDIIWNGAGWTVTYEDSDESHYLSPRRAHVLQLDWLGHTVLSHEQSDAGIGSPSLAVLDGRIMTAWSALSTGAGTSVVELPAAANTPRVATYAATEQMLITTTTSAEATLFVWRETTGNVTTSIRSGVRMHDGRWSERAVVARDAELVQAASNGRQFAILLTNGNDSEVVRMDETGRALGPNLKLPRPAIAIAGNDTHFALLEDTGSPRFARLLSLAGELSPSVEIGSGLANQRIVSDGNGFLVVGQTASWQCSWCQGIGVCAWRLGSELQRIDAQDLELASEPATLAGAEWNGSEYIVAWTARERTVFARVPASPAQSIETRSTDAVVNATDFTTLRDGSLAFVARSEGAAPRIVVVNTEGQLLRSFQTDRADLTGAATVEPLPDGAITFLSSSLQNDAPQHGTSHVMMAVARPTPLPRPDAPTVRARLENGRIEVDWKTPAGTINGYRIEYRVDDGTWNELEDWFSAGALGTWIKQPAFGSRFAIRMRAFNDGGASVYSETAFANPMRRRAVH